MALVVVVSIALGLVPTATEGPWKALTDGWQYRTSALDDLSPLDQPWEASGWSPLSMPAHPSIDDEVLWLRTRLPDLGARDPAIAIDAVLLPFEVFLGGTRVHAHPPPDGIASHRLPGVPWQLVTLPDTPGGRPLTLRIRTLGRSALVRGTPLYGERADLIRWTLSRDAARLACGLLVILVAVSGFVVFVRPRDWRVPTGFLLWTGSLGLYVIHYTHTKDLLLDAPRFWFFVWILAVPALPIGATLFVSEVFGAGPWRVLSRLTRVHAALFALILLVDAACAVLYGSDPKRATAIFSIPLVALRLLYVVTSIAAVVVVSRRAREGHPEARLFLVGLFIGVAFTMNDLLAAAGVASLSWKSLAHWGALSLTISLALILQRRYGAAIESAAAFAAEVRLREREKESLLRDLHDGVGGLTSNIRLLAELGQKSDERAKRSLSTIAELSDRSLSQLRAFVQALDDTTTTWEALAAELRRFGTHLLSAAGVELEVETELRTRELPRALLSVHVLRVFQECVTNALKRRATTVAFALRVDDSRLELVVRSEGAGEEAGAGAVGLDLGRGLVNMRARAKELGGSFSMRKGPTTEVRLFVPLPLRVDEDAQADLPGKPPDERPADSLASER